MVRDKEILALFWARSEQALEAVREQYGEKLSRLAENLLADPRDAEECVSDALMTAWKAIPPEKPEPLLPWLYVTVRRACMNRLRSNRAKKRAGNFGAALEELEEMASSGAGPAEQAELGELTAALERFLRRLPRRDQVLFLGRYWYGEDYPAIALRLGMTQENCRVRMSLIRKKLRKALEKEGVL